MRGCAGAGTLVISEVVQKELGLQTEHVRESTLANGEKAVCKIAEAVNVCWKDRSMAWRRILGVFSAPY